MAERKQPFIGRDGKATIDRFLGLRNNVEPESMMIGDMTEALNVYIDDAGKLHTRAGLTELIAGSDVHSLWCGPDSCLYVDGTDLKVTDLINTSVIESDITQGRPMVYLLVNEQVYYSNGIDNGIIDTDGSRRWGIAIPDSIASPSNMHGDLASGRYQYTMTFVRANGLESGTDQFGYFDVTTGGIYLSDLPVSDDPEVTSKNIYLTGADGEVLYRSVNTDNANTTASISSNAPRSIPLKTEGLQQPPAGEVLAHYNGRIYVGSGNFIYPSMPFNYELFDITEYIPFASEVMIIAPVMGGMFVATDKETVFLRGDGLGKFQLEKVVDYGAIKGTLSYGNTSDFSVEKIPEGDAAVWASTSGICVGLHGGVFFNVTDERYSMSGLSDRGCGAVINMDGSTQYLSIIK